MSDVGKVRFRPSSARPWVSSLRHETQIKFINRRGLLTSNADDSHLRLCDDGRGDPLLDLAIQVDLDIACV